MRVFFSRNLTPTQLDSLRRSNCQPIAIPLIRTILVKFNVSEVLNFKPDILILSSVNGVRHFFSQINPNNFRNSTFIATGNKTSEALKELDFKPIVPDEFSGEGVIELLRKMNLRNKKVLIVKPRISRDIVYRALTTLNVDTKVVTAYETVRFNENREKLIEALNQPIDVFAFTSPSTFEAFLSLSGNRGIEVLKSARIIPIGHVTAKVISLKGFKVWKIPDEYTVDGIIKLLQG